MSSESNFNLIESLVKIISIQSKIDEEIGLGLETQMKFVSWKHSFLKRGSEKLISQIQHT